MLATRKKKQRLWFLSWLVGVAAADGKIADNEKQFLFLLGKKWKLSQSAINKAISRQKQVAIVLPEDRKDKCAQLVDMVLLMMADGVIDARERKLCIAFGNHLGFGTTIVDEYIHTIINLIKQGAKRKAIITALLRKLGFR